MGIQCLPVYACKFTKFSSCVYFLRETLFVKTDRQQKNSASDSTALPDIFGVFYVVKNVAEYSFS